jgi:DNA-binding response OmpR family regulator
VANNRSLDCDCAETILGLKSKRGGQVATKDDSMMEPATEAGNVIFSTDASRRLFAKDSSTVELGAQTLDILIELVSCPNDVVSKNDLLVRAWPDLTVVMRCARWRRNWGLRAGSSH